MGPNTYKIEIDKHLPDDIYSRLCYVFVQAAVEDDWRRLLPYCAQHTVLWIMAKGHTADRRVKCLVTFWKKHEAPMSITIGGYIPVAFMHGL